MGRWWTCLCCHMPSGIEWLSVNAGCLPLRKLVGRQNSRLRTVGRRLSRRAKRAAGQEKTTTLRIWRLMARLFRLWSGFGLVGFPGLSRKQSRML
jgi:hypothetical protein